MAQKIVAFVARSFAPADDVKIEPIVRFLESFTKLGFISHSAEASEVESVSEKVRTLIDKSDVLVGIFTKRHPVYKFDGRLAAAMRILTGSLKPWVWTAPPWVLQESGYAISAKKALILFKEKDVEIPTLQGDLEYILFDPRNPAPAFQRASEMINGLIATAGSIKVDTVVHSDAVDAKQPENPVKAEEKAQGAPTGKEGFRTHFWAMYKAVTSGDWEAAKREYLSGLKWIQEHEPNEELFWECLYQRQLFTHGKPEGLEKLRDLAANNKGEYLPLSYLGNCLADLHEYDEALKCYLDAASIAKPERRASLQINAAEVLEKAKKPKEAKELLLKVRAADYANEPETQFDVLKALYSLSKQSEDKFESFAIAELALRQRPEEMKFRFSLAFDYEAADQPYLSVYHYKIVCEHDEKNASALNNLAVAFAKCDLQILAAKHYRRAYDLGNTLAASNLGYKYLEAGLSDDAITLLKGAQTKEDCVPDIPRTLAAVHEKIEENDRGQEKVMDNAEEHRDFLVAFAVGLLSPTPENLDGRWSLPSGEIDLRSRAFQLRGTREDRTQVQSPFGSLFSSAAPKTITRIEKLDFSATVSGRTCKFKLETVRSEEPAGWSLLGTPSDSKIEGYILFAEDGKSGRVAELKAGKPEKYYQISKAM